jgi:CHAT domain-containing protein
LKETEKALRLYSSEKSEWHWRFIGLKAQILEMQGQNNESLALLNPDLPSAFSTSDFAVRRRLIQALASAYSQHPTEAAQFIAQAQSLAKASHPELLGEVALRKATVCFLAGDYTSAGLAYRTALQSARAQQDPFFEAAALSGLAIVSTKQERYDEAIDWDRAALELSKSIGAGYSLEQALGNTGWCYRKLGDYESALSLYKQAVEVSKQSAIVGDQIYWLSGISNVYYEQRNYPPAQEVLTQALDLARRQDDRTILMEFLTDLSEIAVETGQINSAERYYAEALKLEETDTDPSAAAELTLVWSRIQEAKRDFPGAQRSLRQVITDSSADSSQRWEAEARMASIFAKERLNHQAEDEFRHSLETIEQVRSSVQTEELRLSFLSTAVSFYTDYIEFLIAQGRTRDALQVAETNRARTLAEGLGMHSSSFLARLSKFDPQRLARRLNVTLLFYWIGPERSYLWVITPSALSYFALPKQSEIDPVLKAHRQAILEGRDLLASEGAGGWELYEMLIAPAHNLIPNGSRVIVLPAEGLYGLNFETLIVPQPKPHYWIEDATVSEASSLALLSAASQKAGSSEKSLLLVGNPETPGPDFPLLPQAAEEIQKVSMHFPEPRRKVLEGRQATASAYLQSNPERFSYLHFVTHGTASQTRPLESAVILTKEGDSYKLYARDIVTHPLKADLVTISACNGAGTRAYAGEGLVGLSWAFLRAGAHNVIASLWEVSDASSTAQLMDALYRDLDHGADPATALRNAKLFILKSNSNTVFRKPFYWAPFQLYAGS